MADTLAELYQQKSPCTSCSLYKGATQPVYGDGNEHAEIVFVGEAPGANEDRLGKPFVGQAGKLLSTMLESIGLKREDVYITNVLKCRPPNNRDPEPDEIEACKPMLFEQLEIIKPKVVVTLGSFAARVILGKIQPISKIHGIPVQMGDYLVFPTYHPAAALYARATVDLLQADFRKLKEILEKTPEPAAAPSSTDGGQKAPEPEQLGLF